MRRTVACAALALLAVLHARPSAAPHPETLTPDGGSPLQLVSQAHRVHLLGDVEIYRIALYADGAAGRERLVSADVPKVLRIEITAEDDLRPRLAFDWRDELVPRVELPAMTHLRGTFAPLREGDLVQIEYVPGRGTAVRLNRSVAVTSAPHDLMLAFLDHWLGQRPVSEEIKRALLAGS